MLIKERIRFLQIGLYALFIFRFVSSFIPIQVDSSTRLQRYATQPTKTSEKDIRSKSDVIGGENNEEGGISELDARVLKSMLQDGTVEVGTEEDMRKLLDRGSGSKTASQFKRKFANETDSEFNSRMVQTLTDTKLWKAFSAKADDFFETLRLFARNRAERDSKLLAALAFFVVERVKEDLVRTLPAAAAATGILSKGVKTTAFQLGNSSSFEEVQNAFKKGAETISEETEKKKKDIEEVNLYEEFNTPLDEIKSVTQSIRDILAGETSGASAVSGRRGLKSTAPAGQKSRSERQQRAYQKRKQTVLKREKESVNVGRLTGEIIDAAWEVKQDLDTETNKPGFKTERVRNVLAAGAERTSRAIAAAREGSDPLSLAGLFFASENEATDEEILALEDASQFRTEAIPELPEVPPEPIFSIPEVGLPYEIMDEQESVVARLKDCIEMPEATWLTPDVLFDSEDTLDPDAMSEVVTTMICARDDLSIKVEAKSINSLVKQLKKVKTTVDLVISTADSKAGKSVSKNLSNILYGVDPEDDGILPTLLSLEDIKENYLQEIKDTKVAAVEEYDAAVEERERLLVERERISKIRDRMIEEARIEAKKAEEERLAAERAQAEQEEAEREAANPIDVSFEKEATSFPSSESITISTDGIEVIVDNDSQIDSVTEVITDDIDLDEANKIRTISTEEEEKEEKKEEDSNALVTLSLRTLDIVFVVGEKVVLVGLPTFFKIWGTASERASEVSRGGLGKVGWTRLANTKKGSKRY